MTKERSQVKETKKKAALSPKEKERILRKLNQGITTNERKKSIENATAQSLSRSGGGESADF